MINQGMIDLNLIEKGAKYSKLKKTFIIFICLNVPSPTTYPYILLIISVKKINPSTLMMMQQK